MEDTKKHTFTKRFMIYKSIVVEKNCVYHISDNGEIYYNKVSFHKRIYILGIKIAEINIGTYIDYGDKLFKPIKKDNRTVGFQNETK